MPGIASSAPAVLIAHLPVYETIRLVLEAYAPNHQPLVVASSSGCWRRCTLVGSTSESAAHRHRPGDGVCAAPLV